MLQRQGKESTRRGPARVVLTRRRSPPPELLVLGVLSVEEDIAAVDDVVVLELTELQVMYRVHARGKGLVEDEKNGRMSIGQCSREQWMIS